MPHDNNLDEGIPESEWAEEGKPAPWNTGEELPGTQNIPGSVWGPGVSTDFQTTLGQLNTDGKTLGMVDFRGTESGYLPYWEYWAGLTGGQALLGGTKELASKVTTLIETRATTTLPPCPAGQVRNASGVCVPQHPSVTQVICNLVIATASDTCTATVADGAATEASNPTGTVAFTSASGGVFSAGNTCSLVSTPLSRKRVELLGPVPATERSQHVAGDHGRILGRQPACAQQRPDPLRRGGRTDRAT